MPNYGFPGVAIHRRGALVVGFVALVLVAVVAVGGYTYSKVRGDDRLRIELLTEAVGAGIVVGSDVRLDGVPVGRVEAIDSADRGTQKIALALDGSQLWGLTDQLSMDYAPANLFGISEIELKRGTGGSPLTEHAVVDLAGQQAHRVADATMGTFLNTLAKTATDVLTPQLTDVLVQIGTDVKAFTPLVEAIIMTARTVAETQQYAPSYQIGQWASVLAGAPPFISGAVQVLDVINHIEGLRTEQGLFDSTVNLIANEVLPAVSHTSNTAEKYFSGYADMATPLLWLVAQMVPAPQQSSADIRELLARLDRSFSDTPEGPALNLRITLSRVPGFAVPLLGPAGPPLGDGPTR